MRRDGPETPAPCICTPTIRITGWFPAQHSIMTLLTDCTIPSNSSLTVTAAKAAPRCTTTPCQIPPVRTQGERGEEATPACGLHSTRSESPSLHAWLPTVKVDPIPQAFGSPGRVVAVAAGRAPTVLMRFVTVLEGVAHIRSYRLPTSDQDQVYRRLDGPPPVGPAAPTLPRARKPPCCRLQVPCSRPHRRRPRGVCTDIAPVTDTVQAPMGMHILDLITNRAGHGPSRVPRPLASISTVPRPVRHRLLGARTLPAAGKRLQGTVRIRLEDLRPLPLPALGNGAFNSNVGCRR